jgi:hypothetical protein
MMMVMMKNETSYIMEETVPFSVMKSADLLVFRPRLLSALPNESYNTLVPESHPWRHLSTHQHEGDDEENK